MVNVYDCRDSCEEIVTLLRGQFTPTKHLLHQQQHFLFLDTESSGLPKKWDVPYSVNDNWPFVVQAAWVVYSLDGREIKRRNFYINNEDFSIEDAAFKIHGITDNFRTAQGVSRSEMLAVLTNDMTEFNPMVIGHFIEFDVYILGADYYRENLVDPLTNAFCFCTMRATQSMVQNPALKFLRLGHLYEMLFNKKLLEQHNALIDAIATADCFFKLLETGYLDHIKIDKGKFTVQEPVRRRTKIGCSFPVFIFLFLIVLIFIL